MAALKPPVNERDHIQGSKQAQFEMVEYGDYQCPHCGRAHPVVKRLQKKLGDQLRFVFRNFPLSNVHEYALAAAIASEAAARQNKFWEMHDYIFEHQDQLNEEGLQAFAEKLQLNMDQFNKDILDESLAEKVDSDFESGVRSGVNGTPSFFINGKKFEGGYDFVSLSEAFQI